MTLFYFDDMDSGVIAYSATWITYVGVTGSGITVVGDHSPNQTASASSASATSSVATSTSAAAAAPAASPSSGSSSGTAVGVGVGVGLGVLGGLALLGGWYLWKRRRRVPGSIETMQTEPMGQRSVAGDSLYSPSSPQGATPYIPQNRTYGGAPSEYGRQSAYASTVPEVQEHQQLGPTSYYSAPSLQSSQALDNPSTFRPR
ncbi:hypothetical protein JCM1841_006683 [Sporobolomyces salmonicolor]